MRREVWVTTGLLAAALTPRAWAGGIWLYEMGTPDLGTASAGMAALAADASTAFRNPAGMTQLNRAEIVGAAQALYSDFQFDTDESGFGGGDGGNAGGFVPAASLHYVHPVTEDLRLGVTAGSYFGFALDYGNNWSGRYYSTRSDLITLGVNPTVAYRFNDRFSAGVGFTILYADLDQTVAVNNGAVPGQAGLADGRLKMSDDDVGYGFDLGLMFTPRDGTRIGFTYRSQIDLEFNDAVSLKNIGPVLEGLLTLSGLAGSTVDIDVTIPENVVLSVYQQLNDSWAIMGNIGWQGWSDFGKQDFALRSGDVTKFTADRNFDDTWHFALGAQYRFAERWLWSVGAAYDSSAVDDEDRTPDLPVDRQIRIGTGIQYDLHENLTVGAAYEYFGNSDARIDLEGGSLQGTLKGEYDPAAGHWFALNLRWRL